MESEEKPAEEVSKMEEAVAEKPEPEKETKPEPKEETTVEELEASKEEPEVKMEIEETQLEEDSSKVTDEVTMETEPTPAPIKEETPKEETLKVEENSQKDDTGEEKSVEREDKTQEETAKDKLEVDLEKEVVNDKTEDKLPDVKLSTSPEPTGKEPAEVADELGDDFNVLGTDDENDDKKDEPRSGVWMPNVNVIIDLYQKLDKEGVLELQWKCVGRRPPPEEVGEKKEESQKIEKEAEKPAEEEETQEEEPTEFDFDVDTPSVTSMAPRRTPGSGQAFGSSKKRVARMDKIFNDMLRHQKIDEELAKAGDESDDPANRTDTTPQRPVGKFRIRKDF